MRNRKSDISKFESRAFTLVELLVVIGIITVLIGILIPVAGKMRTTAKSAVTQQLISTLEAGINQYQTDTGDWPGPFDSPPDRTLASTGVVWNQLTPGVATSALTVVGVPGGDLRVTRSEELLLCLVGGLTVNRDTSPPFAVSVSNGFTYNYQDLDRGHPYLGIKQRGRLNDYLATTKSRSDATGSNQYVNDTVVPEFMDSFDNPILYVRAVKGRSDVTAYYTYTNINDATIDMTNSVLALEALRYMPAANVLFPPTYLQSDNLTAGPTAPFPPTRQRDRYILISAGPDKKFGTADDITNFGSPKMTP